MATDHLTVQLFLQRLSGRRLSPLSIPSQHLRGHVLTFLGIQEMSKGRKTGSMSKNQVIDHLAMQLFLQRLSERLLEPRSIPSQHIRGHTLIFLGIQEMSKGRKTGSVSKDQVIDHLAVQLFLQRLSERLLEPRNIPSHSD